MARLIFPNYFCIAVVVFISIWLSGYLGTASVYAADDESNQPVDIAAEKLYYDDERNIISALGKVELEQNGKVLFADEVIYALDSGLVIARGNVALNEEDGDVHFADEVKFTSELENGSIINLSSVLADGSRINADNAVRRNGNKTVMRHASYSPCKTCNLKSCGKKPVWRIVAEKVTHDQEEARISYNNARFEMFGVPVVWLPYFSHPDGTLKQKSGFLTPSFGYDSEQGLFVENRYYQALSEDKDLTIGTRVFTNETPILLAEYRQLWSDAYMEIGGSGTYSSRTDSVNDVDVELEEEWRGHIYGNALWDINNKWRAGIDLDVVSDDQYLREYDFDSDEVLENSIYAERFSGRNYASIRALAFQDVRVDEDRAEDQPDILPEAFAEFYGEPNQMLGGRWHVAFSGLGLHRDGSGQDMDRAVMQADWEKRFVSNYGISTTLTAETRADAYYVSDRDLDSDIDSDASDGDGTYTRTFGRLYAVSSYPLVKQYNNSQWIIEPKVALSLSPRISDNTDIPNEDSDDVQIDASNLFNSDRFAGYDRIEDGSRATYGVKTGLYGNKDSHIEGFLGQSYRISGDDSPFPENSGLENDGSDIVGQVSAKYGDLMSADYRFQLGAKSLASQRHEAEMSTNLGGATFGGRYLFAKAVENTDIEESREQVEASASYMLSDSWRARTSAIYDLGEEDHGLRKSIVGVDYLAQCINFSTTVTRKLTRESSGDSGTEIMFTIGLKNLGEFEAPITVSGDEDDDDDDDSLD